MSDAGKETEGSQWGWYVGGLLLAAFVLHLPWMLVFGEQVLFGTERAYAWFDSVGIVDLLDPIYKQTIGRIF